MKKCGVYLREYFRFDNVSPNAVDGFALLYIVASFAVFWALTLNLGLYADDYWNLLEAKKYDTFQYFKNHLTHINSRYTYALVNRLLFVLFYDAKDVFAALYIRASFTLIYLFHYIGVFFTFKSLAKLGVPKIALLVLLPFLCFPVYGHQALMWLGAAFAYPVGFALFSGAVYALLCGRAAVFAVSAFFALGATEFVLLPLFAITAAVWLFQINDPEKKAFGSKDRIITGLILIAPFVAWALLVGLTPAAAARSERVHGYPKLLDAPDKWLVAYTKAYLKRLLPEMWMRDYWIFFPAAAIGLTAFIRGRADKVLMLLLVSFYFISIFPLSAVGYNFWEIRSARIWYFSGIFFYTALVSGIALVLKRLPLSSFPLRLRTAAPIAAAVITLGLSVPFIARVAEIASDGEKAYGCVRGIIHTVEVESGGAVPKKVEVCGLPNAIYDFSVFRSIYAGPHGLGLAFNLNRTVPFVYTPKCPKKWGAPWQDDQCPAKARYNITY